jgi:hypothetical protein
MCIGASSCSSNSHQPAAISVAISHLIRALELEAISHHTRRHTGATVMVCNGIALRAVQTLGWWSSPRMSSDTRTSMTSNSPAPCE